MRPGSHANRVRIKASVAAPRAQFVRSKPACLTAEDNLCFIVPLLEVTPFTGAGEALGEIWKSERRLSVAGPIGGVGPSRPWTAMRRTSGEPGRRTVLCGSRQDRSNPFLCRLHPCPAGWPDGENAVCPLLS